MKSRFSSITAALMTLSCAIRADGATITLSAVADTSLFEAKPDSNLGGTTLVAGTNQQFSRSRAMFRFDLGDIPDGAVVTGVVVELYVTRQPDPDRHGGPVPSDFSLHRLFVDWGEGTGGGQTGSVAMLGDATWNERIFGAAAWGTPGGQIGTDFANEASATTSVGNVGRYSWGTTTGLVDDVQAWLDSPESNFGFMLVNQSESTLGTGRRFSATEQPGGEILPPRLLVTYELVPEPSASLLAIAGLMMLGFRRTRAAAAI